MPNNFAETLQKKINIGGHEIPVWVLALGAGVAGFVLLNRGTGSTTGAAAIQPAQPADSGATPAPTPVPSTNAVPVDTSAIQDAAAQLQGQIAAMQAEINAANAKAVDLANQRTNDFASTIAPIATNYAADNAAQYATLRAAQPVPVSSTSFPAPTVQAVPPPAAPPPKPVPLPSSEVAAANPELAYTRAYQQNNAPSSYTVVSGDTLSAIARRNSTTVQNILSLNPQIKNPNLIYPGQVFQLR